MVLGGILMMGMVLLILHNSFENHRAGREADEALLSVKGIVIEPVPKEAQSEEVQLAGEESSSEMTVVEIDGYGYIGYLSIPELELELPIMSEIDTIRLKTAPCRYYGSTKTDDLVIAGHNYARHFGTLYTLKTGDSVTFTDMDGVIHDYEVEELEILAATEVPDMIEGKYPLTLYTCTFGGKERVTVRCKKIAALP